MSRRIITVFLVFVLCYCIEPNATFAQVYRNEWINFSSNAQMSDQQYFKIKITAEGVYRIPAALLSSKGMPIATIPINRYQVFYQGAEQAIHVEDADNSGFLSGTTDFVEFYGKRNDGVLDRDLYVNTQNQMQSDSMACANPNYSLFCDTAVYFLTWRTDAAPTQRLIDETNTSVNAPTLNYFLAQSYAEYATNYLRGYSGVVAVSDYMQGEGWFDGSTISSTTSITKSVNSPNVYTSGPSTAECEVVHVPFSITFPHQFKVDVGSFSTGNTLPVIDAYAIGRYTINVPVNQLSFTSNFIFKGIGTAPDQTRLAYVKLTYPHAFTFAGESFSSYRMLLPPDGQPVSSFNFSGYAASGQEVLYDLGNHRRIPLNTAGTGFNVPPGSGASRVCLFAIPQQITTIEPVNGDGYFHNYMQSQGDYLIVTHSSLWTSALNYSYYRHSAAGGAHTVVLLDIDELYDQFAWGIAKHGLSIRNFARFALANWTEKPEYLFLIGKSYGKHDGADLSLSPRKVQTYFNLHLLPCWSMFASDNSMTLGLGAMPFKPALATGRIAARTSADVDMYLRKVKDYESQVPGKWMKHIVHMSGGDEGTTGQVELLRNYMDTYRDIAQDTSFGGHVLATFSRTSANPLSMSATDSLRQMLKDGLSFLTFFGHSNTQGFDVGVDQPSDWNNIHRYPFVTGLGCSSGEMYTNYMGVGEKFVFSEMEGAIGFIGENTSGYISTLGAFANFFYTKFARENYHQPIGKVIQSTLSSCYDPQDLLLRQTFLSMNLQCDPGVIINSLDKPDLIITPQDVYFSPDPVTTEQTNFTIHVVTTNIGKAIDAGHKIKIKRTFPDGLVSYYGASAPAVYYKDTVAVIIPVGDNGAGANHFEVWVDSSNVIDEYSETNNYATAELFIESTELVPIYPKTYAIVPSQVVTLKSGTANAFAPARSYTLELDTTDTFDSPYKKTTSLVQSGGVVSWGPLSLLPQDSMVYFWRAQYTGSTRWRESSFQVIQDRRGWSQAHYFQFLKGDSMLNLQTNRSTRINEFISHTTSVKVQTMNKFVAPWLTNAQGIYNSILTTNNTTLHSYAQLVRWTSNPNGILVAVFDSLSGAPWVDPSPYPNIPYGIYGNFHQVNVNLYAFEFRTDSPVYRDTLRMFLQNTVPAGAMVAIYTGGNNNFANYEPSLIAAMHASGCGPLFDTLQANPLLNGRPYASIARKSVVAVPNEVFGATDSSLIVLNATMSNWWTDGNILSERIGPAQHWQSLHWKSSPFPGSSTSVLDTIKVSLVGYKTDGAIDTLISNLQSNTTDTSLAWISALDYPYLKLYSYVSDKQLRTPLQLDRWQILFDEVPEAALNPSRYLSFYKDDLQQGDSVRLSTVVENIGSVPFDPMWLDYWVNDNERTRHSYPHLTTKTLAPGAFDTVSIKLPTRDLPGANYLWLEANPFNGNHLNEQEHANNMGVMKFNVSKDVTNPLLDVTFDGVHILNGDIVSAKPEIVMQLKDDNAFLALDDTSDFRIWLRYPNASVQTRLFFEPAEQTGTAQSRLMWSKAQLPENKFRIRFKPELMEDGSYELIVESQDVSHNVSGKLAYRLTFEVVNKSTITQVLNYPNPFTSSTRFAFVLTGSEVPSYFKIQIMTVTGKVVREISRDQIGPIHIGRNLTEYAWDGTDEYGDRLANGVYLYRVTTRLNNESIELRKTAADTYFKQDWGKLYLMR